MKRYCYICGYETEDDTLTTCPRCLCDNVFVCSKEEEDIVDISSDRSFIDAMMELKEKDPIEYQLKLNQFKLQLEQKRNIEKQKEQQNNIQRQQVSKQITCPRCGSTNITTGSRGFSLVTGFIGSGKTVNRCASCGYKWKPGSFAEAIARDVNGHH